MTDLESLIATVNEQGFNVHLAQANGIAGAGKVWTCYLRQPGRELAGKSDSARAAIQAAIDSKGIEPETIDPTLPSKEELESAYQAVRLKYIDAMKSRENLRKHGGMTDDTERDFHKLQNEFVKARDAHVAVGGKLA